MAFQSIFSDELRSNKIFETTPFDGGQLRALRNAVVLGSRCKGKVLYCISLCYYTRPVRICQGILLYTGGKIFIRGAGLILVFFAKGGLCAAGKHLDFLYQSSFSKKTWHNGGNHFDRKGA